MNINTFIQIGQIIPKNIISDVIRSIFVALDSITFSFIGIFFNAIFSITKLENMSIITNLYDTIQEKIYLVIGIFMLFKVTISLLTYLANPDKINDKEMGVSKLVTRIVTSLVLLILVPTIVFPFLTEIQIPILNTVGKIITGNSDSIDNNSAFSDGEEAALNIMKTFLYVDPDCNDASNEYSNIFETVEVVNDSCETADGTDNTKYKYTYVFGVSNIIATVTVILLVIIAINIAIRAFKLMVLKILAPIPILSYIDPKSSKDGIFSSYTKLFVKTYLDLFIQFGVFFLVITILSRVLEIVSLQNLGLLVNTGVEYLSNDITGISFVFIFIGLLVFAIMAPKFIKKALNIKDSEFGSGLAGILTTGTMLAGTTGAAVSGFATSAANGGGLLKNMGAGIAGAIGGLTTGAKSGFASGKTDSSKVLSSINDYNARARANADAGVGLQHKLGNWLGTTFMGQSPFEKQKAVVEAYDQYYKDYVDFDSEEKKEATKGKYGSVSATNNRFAYDQTITGTSKDFASQAATARAQGLSDWYYIDRDTKQAYHIDTGQNEFITSELEKAEQESYHNRLLAGDTNIVDARPDLVAKIDKLSKDFDKFQIGQAEIKDSNGRVISAIGAMSTSAKNLGDQMKKLQTVSTNIKSSTEYMAAAAASKNKK